MTLIKHPFKKKRSTVGDGKRSQSMTPKSTRGSMARSSSLASSVNSYEESEYVVESNLNASTKNIYADIDDDNKFDVATNIPASCDEKPPELPAANVVKLKVIQVPQISECEQFDEFVDDLLSIPGIENKFNCSKNNLLLIDDHLMATSIDNHLNNIELINRNLDKLMQTQQTIEGDENDDDGICPEVKAEKKLKAKIAEKIKMLREARMNAPGTSDGVMKESFKSRVKNIFPKFERQESSEKPKGNKGFLSSFMKKSTSIPDETDEDFEEIKKNLPEDQIKTTAIEESGKSGGKFSSKLKQKLKLITIKPKKSPLICHRCSKKYATTASGSQTPHNKADFDFSKEFHSEKLFDNDFCVCVDFDEFDDDGICIKNFAYKDVSVFMVFACCMQVRLLLHFLMSHVNLFGSISALRRSQIS